MKTRYTVGFLFNEDRTMVLLIRKEKPKSQAGKLNGIGGHIEDGETAGECQLREFNEEVEYPDKCLKWKPYAQLDGTDFNVECFYGTGKPELACAKTKERLELWNVKYVNSGHPSFVDNVPWLVQLAIDSMAGSRPAYTVAYYYPYPI